MSNKIISRIFVFALTSITACTASAAGSPASEAFEALKTDASEYITYAWGLAVLIVGATVGIKLFKKFVNRAS